MICHILRTLADSLAQAGHGGQVKLRLPPSAFAALLEELRPMMRVVIPEELQRGARRSVKIHGVEVVE